MKAMLLIGYKTENYGSVLQSVATYEMIRKLDIECNVINLDALWKSSRKKKLLFYIIHFELPFLIKSKGGMAKNRINALSHSDYGEGKAKRKDSFRQFLNSRLQFTKEYKKWKELQEDSENYDYVILGSDQVWLPSSVVTDVYTLSFATKARKIAYAPSFGIKSIPVKYWPKYKKMLDDLDAVSVREINGQSIIREISGKECPVVLDPVFMISRKEWISIISLKRLVDEDYIFVYLLGKNKWQREYIKKVSQKTKLPIVGLIHLDEYIASDCDLYDKCVIGASPEEMLNYIRGAKYIFTDSFHGAAFSIIENKEFWVFERFAANSVASTNDRIYSLLNVINLKDRIITKNDDVIQINNVIDYQIINEKINEYITKSYCFLIQAIKEE